MDYRTQAHGLIASGISVVPLKIDGSKLPGIRWKDFQTRYMAPQEVEHHFSDCGGVAAITGRISKLFVLDFDLKYQLPHQDYWAYYNNVVGKDLLDKCLINKTMSGGFHIWMRTAYEDKSRKITRRYLTPDEIAEKYKNIVEKGANPETAMRLILNNPTETVIESRSKGSYAVIAHPSYEKVSGEKVELLSAHETRYMIDAAYSLDCLYRKRRVYTGDVEVHKVVEQFNEDCGAEGVVQMLEMSGLYQSIGADYNGNYQMKRIGSPSKYSGYVYKDSALFKSFGMNVLSSNRDVLSPFEVYCIINGWEDHPETAVQAIQEKLNERP